jgi:hypothetical protein
MDEAQDLKVKIKDFVDALEMQSDEFLSFVDPGQRPGGERLQRSVEHGRGV